MNVEVRYPFSSLVLTYPIEEIEKALKFLKTVAPTPDLDTSLEVAWSLCRNFDEKQKDYLSLIQTIVSATRDGLVKPEEFDVYKVWERF